MAQMPALAPAADRNERLENPARKYLVPREFRIAEYERLVISRDSDCGERRCYGSVP